ncbi:hypothetical protein LCD52_16475 [Rossellomorea vietnamensis]|uniref:hypothetical protein n=1 Tax=Rossellomorea vietnamensis TaxID=218284 RepID=UPI001CCF9036|nr:hypothetical protein [Rossellomorea vietnamensis]MCA0150382.1 hypothetical protein [Rossellomorea vietnamensis]
MKLSDIVSSNEILVKDGYFELLAQCTIFHLKNILTFLEDEKFVDYINTNKSISCVICRSEHRKQISNKNIGIICVDQPKLFFFKIHNELSKKEGLGLSFKTKIGDNCNISPLATISNANVNIGNEVIIEDNVIIKPNVTIGDGSIIRSGAIIGGQGYEYKRDKETSILRVEHAGKTIIDKYVEIKELCTIHQAVFSWDYTCIGEHSKLDAHTHLGHATKIGKRVMIGSHGNLAGNISIENDVYIGPGVTISNRLNIGRRSKISIGSVVTKDVDEGKTVTGNFAIDHTLFIKHLKETLDIE